jgi:hypothetical protein
MTTPEPFQELNQLYFSGQTNLALKILYPKVETLSSSFFSKDYTQHDIFFGQFTPIWNDLLIKHRYPEAEEIWHIALSIANNWEKTHAPIHKGTPYYFLGVSQILNNNLEDGFFSMHQALEEDKRTLTSKNPTTPAYFFTTLDYDNAGQFFRPKLIEISQYLSQLLTSYNKERSGNLSLNDFKKEFLENISLREEIFIFVYSLFKLKKLLIDTDKEILQNELSAILHSKLFFDVSLIIEKIIEYKNPAFPGNTKLMFSDEMAFLRQNGLLTFTQVQFDQFNRDFNNDFKNTLKAVLNKTYTINLPNIEDDLMITYRIRNFAAHKIQTEDVFYEENVAISQRLFNVLFFIIEKLYNPQKITSSTTVTTTSKQIAETSVTNIPPHYQI